MTKQVSKDQKAKAKILIIDNFGYGNLLEEILQYYGYLTQLAPTGKDGQEFALSGKFDLAIVEYSLADMTGIEVARELQRQEIPFLMLSGINDPDVVKQASATGAHAYLIKPVSPEQLFSTIEATLRHTEEIKGLRESSACLTSTATENREISVAIGILIDHLKVPEYEARNRIRNKSRCERRKLSELAGELVAAADIFYHNLEKFETE